MYEHAQAEREKGAATDATRWRQQSSAKRRRRRCGAGLAVRFTCQSKTDAGHVNWWTAIRHVRDGRMPDTNRSLFVAK